MDLHNMKMTPEEHETLDWCYLALDEAEVAEIEEEAQEIAAAEINASEPADKLLPLLVAILVRHAREGGGAR